MILYACRVCPKCICCVYAVYMQCICNVYAVYMLLYEYLCEESLISKMYFETFL